MSRALRPISFAAGVLAVLVACGGDSSSSSGTAPSGNPNGGGNNTTPATIEISPSGSVTLDALQATQPVSATVKSSSGNVVSANVTWTSDAPTIASVPSSGGSVTALANGTARITAKTDNGIASAPLTLLVQQKASQLARVSGDAQQGTVNTALGAPLVVQATDRNNNPVAATGVTFATTNGTLGTSSATTGTDGRAATTWTLPTTSGVTSATASLTSDASKSVSFSATATPGPAQKLLKVDGDGQRATVSTQLPTQIVAAAVDQFNNGVPNVTIVFAVTAGGGFLNSIGGATNASGQTVVTWTLGPDSIAPQTAQAATGGHAGSPVIFTATGIRASLNTLGPSPFKAGCHLSATINGVTQTDLPKISVTFDGVPATSITLTNQSGRSATLTAVAPPLTRANGSTAAVVIKIYSQTINQGLTYDTGASCT
jgi:hypothetical protein